MPFLLFYNDAEFLACYLVGLKQIPLKSGAAQ